MQTGITTIKSKKYYFDDNGVMQTGLIQINSKTYYFDKKGVMQTGWETVSKKTYYFSSSGVAQTGLKTISKKTYYFDSSGIMQTGFEIIKSKIYYFNKKGVMLTGLQTISKSTYYFSSKGVMQTKWKTIKSNKYYFGTDGKMVKNTALLIDGVYYIFDKNGIYDPSLSYFTVNGIKVHAQYKTDTQVTTEQLLATIIYCEAGNQKQYPVSGTVDGANVTVYKGQLAVGYVIANRKKSNKDYKEVIYELNQFEPARTGVLTKYLNNYSSVSTECKNAAKIIINDVTNKSNSVPAYKRTDFDWYNFWSVTYANNTNFFSVYNSSEYEIIQGHVFFNYTKTITK
jgi:glucan-binding repeat-containing protein